MIYFTCYTAVLPVFSSSPPASINVSRIRESLRLNCSAKGSPLPAVTWYKNDVSMPVINNVANDEFTSELVIAKFQPEDQATYRCVARNVYNDTVETSSRICKSSMSYHQDCQQSVLCLARLDNQLTSPYFTFSPPSLVFL